MPSYMPACKPNVLVVGDGLADRMCIASQASLTLQVTIMNRMHYSLEHRR